jgi:hypothetical protein
MRTERRRQRDLFESNRPLRNLVPDQRAKITALLQALLTEAAAEIQDTAGEEVRNDEDRS